jgi:hypothetical protein
MNVGSSGMPCACTRRSLGPVFRKCDAGDPRAAYLAEVKTAAALMLSLVATLALSACGSSHRTSAESHRSAQNAEGSAHM